jgi:ketosteroid isomerase-like protein
VDLLRTIRSRLKPGTAQATIRNVIDCGPECVVVEQSASAVNVQGESFEQTMCFIYKFRGDTIVSIEEYVDTETLTRYLSY